ncbi:MAG: S-methyl-5-thioribose-1-phosphate isomerase [Proteobacteria bacterium]|nr:S-methyl-5-thioribose-1-phosphate isomerase [Pseudomonadota bacterium]
MMIGGERLQSIWYDRNADTVCIIDQSRLPHEFEIIDLNNLGDACHAITSMQVRGAPLIGVTAAYGVYLALRDDPASLEQATQALLATRPTAVNLQWALQRMNQGLAATAVEQRVTQALEVAQLMEKEDIAICEAIGEHGAAILANLWEAKRESQSALNVLTHCNAGALATVDWGTALAVVYKAVAAGVPVHVWVDETRPRNQGAALTCWELGQQDIPHTLVVDNAGGHLMQQGKVDICVVGSDRTTLDGDVCNKIGTYLKALAADDNAVPFYAAVPISSIDFSATQEGIPIEERAADEVSHITGLADDGLVKRVRVAPHGVAISNIGFDITPARLVTGIITERGVFEASRASLQQLSTALD